MYGFINLKIFCAHERNLLFVHMHIFRLNSVKSFLHEGPGFGQKTVYKIKKCVLGLLFFFSVKMTENILNTSHTLGIVHPRDSSPKNGISVINYSLSCHSKPVRPSSSSMEHNLYIFDEILELSDPPIDSNVTTTFKAQKGSKDIVKIVNVTSVYRLPPPALAAPHVSWYSLKRVAKTDTEIVE